MNCSLLGLEHCNTPPAFRLERCFDDEITCLSKVSYNLCFLFERCLCECMEVVDLIALLLLFKQTHIFMWYSLLISTKEKKKSLLRAL
jgi:hypothetical protein